MVKLGNEQRQHVGCKTARDHGTPRQNSMNAIEKIPDQGDGLDAANATRADRHE